MKTYSYTILDHSSAIKLVADLKRCALNRQLVFSVLYHTYPDPAGNKTRCASGYMLWGPLDAGCDKLPSDWRGPTGNRSLWLRRSPIYRVRGTADRYTIDRHAIDLDDLFSAGPMNLREDCFTLTQGYDGGVPYLLNTTCDGNPPFGFAACNEFDGADKSLDSQLNDNLRGIFG